MALTLQTLQEYIWEHLDLDEEDVTINMLDTWAREGSRRLYNMSRRLPYFEATWELETTPGESQYDLRDFSGETRHEPDVISSVAKDGRALQWAGPSALESSPIAMADGSPSFYSTWGNRIELYPRPNDVQTYICRGYRKMADWTSDPDNVPDLPDDLHDCVRTWMLGACYNQQEDVELGVWYGDLFIDDAERVINNMERLPTHAPLVIGSGPTSTWGRLGRPRYPWE